MAHVAKHTRAAAGHLCKHYERARDESGEYLKFGNQDIDPARTEQNYNLAPEREEGQAEFIRRRTGEVKCLNRKDVNVMCSWAVTAPQAVAGDDKMEREFFAQAYKFLTERYGEQNTISAYVHMDETTPHMHYAFVPVVTDKKTGKEKVSAKEKVNRADLQTFHEDLEKHLAQHFGREVGILNGATKDGNRSIEELKRGTAAEQLREVSQKAQDAAQKERKALKGLEVAQAEKKAVQGEIAAIRGTLGTFAEIDQIGKRGFGGKVSMTAEDAAQLKQQAKAYYAERTNAQNAQALADRLRGRYSQHEKLREENTDLRGQLHKVKRERDTARAKVKDMTEVIQSNPELVAAYNRQLEVIDAAEKQRRRQQRGMDFSR